jgi:hypothetical protein
MVISKVYSVRRSKKNIWVITAHKTSIRNILCRLFESRMNRGRPARGWLTIDHG